MSTKRRGKPLNMGKVAGDMAKALQSAQDKGEAYEQEKLARQMRIKPIPEEDATPEEDGDPEGKPPRQH